MKKFFLLGALCMLLRAGADFSADFGTEQPKLFDGKTLCEIENSQEFAPTDKLTVKCKYQFDDINFKNKNWVCLIDKSDTSRNGFVMQYYFGQPSILINTDKGTFTVDRFTPGYRIVPVDKEWHELSAIYDGKTLSLFLDGMMLGSTKAAGNLRKCTRPAALGGAAVLKARYFTGKIAGFTMKSSVDNSVEQSSVQMYFPKVIKNTAVYKAFRFLENEKELVIGNSQADFIFAKNGRGIEFANIIPKDGKAVFAVQDNFMAAWILNFSDAAMIAGNSGCKFTGFLESYSDRLTLILEKECPTGKITERYSITPDSKFIRADAVFTHTGSKDAHLETVSFNLSNLALGGDIKQNRFIYPPHAFNFLHGEMSEADAKTMNSRYIYGNLMSTDKMMLPYAMIYNKNQPLTIAMAITKRDAKNFIGVFGGKIGSLCSRSVISKRMTAGQQEVLPSIIISFDRNNWQGAMAAQRDLMLKEYQWKKVRETTADLSEMVILWDGIPGVGVETFEDLAKWMPEYRKIGINALICGGRSWFCYFEKDPSVPAFIPIPVGGKVIPSVKSGGIEGLKKLRQACIDNNIRMMAWGPVSMSGMDKRADEGNTNPEWFNRKADGSWNKWYDFMIPGNPGNPGWRKFYIDNVRNMIGNYGLQGLWFDSSWQDHRYNFKSPSGYFGESNGNVNSLLREIAENVQQISPDAVLLGETCGIEAHMALDLVYTAMHGIWPAIPAEDVQDMVIAESLCRLPGFRYLGQVTMGLGFAPILGKEKYETAKKYRDSWIARTFLVSTSGCTPVYFGMNWTIGYALKDTQSLNDEKIPEARSARENIARSKEWVELLKRLNEVRAANIELRQGETIFSAITVSDKRIVNFVRCHEQSRSVILLNAEVEKVDFKVNTADLAALGLESGRKYQITELMSGKVISTMTGDELLKNGIDLSLAAYQGVILKFNAM